MADRAGSRPGMRRWVVTGPIGAGKSQLTSLLAARGAVIVDGDRLGHQLLREPAVAAAISCEFGAGVSGPGGVDRRRLGHLVFGDLRALQRLNSLMHPLLAARIRRRLAELAADRKTDLAVLEAAVYFLLPSVGPIDLTIAIVAEEQIRRNRLVASGRLTPAEARRRCAAQRSWESLWPRADVVLRNEGSLADLKQATARLLATYLGGKT